GVVDADAEAQHRRGDEREPALFFQEADGEPEVPPDLLHPGRKHVVGHPDNSNVIKAGSAVTSNTSADVFEIDRRHAQRNTRTTAVIASSTLIDRPGSRSIHCSR